MLLPAVVEVMPHKTPAWRGRLQSLKSGGSMGFAARAREITS